MTSSFPERSFAIPESPRSWLPGLRGLPVGPLPALFACAEVPNGDPAALPLFAEPIVLFVGPDAEEIDRLRETDADDFHVAADDLVWRSAAYELLERLEVPSAEAVRGAAWFQVEARPRWFSREYVDLPWFLVAHDGKREPAKAADIDPPVTLNRPGMDRTDRRGRPPPPSVSGPRPAAGGVRGREKRGPGSWVQGGVP